MFLKSLTKFAVFSFASLFFITLSISFAAEHQPWLSKPWAPETIMRTNPETGNNVTLDKIFETDDKAFYQPRGGTKEPDNSMCEINASLCELAKIF